MNKYKVLIVEDEEDISSILKINLEADGFDVHTLTAGSEVLPYVLNHHPDIILLDVMIPDLDGFSVCKLLKSDPHAMHIPIIFLTAKAMEHNVISGLEIGGDDYITKPFSISVVISRIKAVLRRSKPTNKTNQQAKTLSAGGLTIDQLKMTVKSKTNTIDINTTEFHLLTHLMQNPGWVFRRSQLIEACKGEDNFVTDRSIDVLMVSLRKKLGDHSHLIETVRGVGYKFKDLEN